MMALRHTASVQCTGRAVSNAVAANPLVNDAASSNTCEAEARQLGRAF
jgi:hypothetical protein